MTPPRPEPFERFAQEASRLGDVEAARIFDLFDLIQAPATLQSLFALLPQLPEILSATVKIATVSELPVWRYKEAQETAIALQGQPSIKTNPRLRDLLPPVPIPRYGPCTGILESHPLYSFLAEQVLPTERHDSFIYLQGHVLLAMEALAPLNEKQLAPSLKPFRCLRNFANHRHWDALSVLPSTPLPTTTFADLFEKAFQGTKFQLATNIFRFAATGFRPHKKRRVTPPEKGFRPKIKDLDGDDNIAELYLREPAFPTALLPEEANAYRDSGGRPEELGPDIDLEPVLPRDKYNGPTRRQLAYQARHANNHRALANQFCKLAWNQANGYDIQILLSFLQSSVQPTTEFSPLAREEVSVLLGLMLFACNPFERFLPLKIYRQMVPGPGGPEGIYVPKSSPVFLRLHSPGPDLAQPHAPQGAFPVDHYVHIPLPPIVRRHLEGLAAKDSDARGASPLFKSVTTIGPEKLATINSQLRKLFNDLNRCYGTRLHLVRICNYLLFKVAEERFSDLPSALLFFGRNDKMCRTRIHYTLAPAQQLESMYRTCCNDLLVNSGMEPAFDQTTFVNENQHLGTPFCPKPEPVKELTRRLQSGISAASRSTFDHRHNLYALYTAMLFSFGTGYRAVNDPSFQEIQIDFDNNLGIIADKGKLDYRTRYVYLAPVILEHLIEYRQHIQKVYGSIGLSSPSLFDLLKTLEFEGLPLNLFWIDEDGTSIKLLSPGLTKEKLLTNHRYDIPLNAGRHYLKYRLLQAGCSPELIEAQLGHWENGQEAWGPYSNLDPLDFSREMARFLPAILEQDGWKAIRGLA